MITQNNIQDYDDLSYGSLPTMPADGVGNCLGRIDQYELLRKLGGGGFGVVYLAKDTAGGIEVALKTLHPLIKHNMEEMEAIREKFALVSRLSHPNIASALVLHPVRDVSIPDESTRQELRLSPGDFVMVMRFAPGTTLSKWRSQFPGGVVPLEMALQIGSQIAAALDYAHSERIVHRDIKPANIMVETVLNTDMPKVRILDFGLAAAIRSSMARVSTEMGDTSGTRPYMAPEQWVGRKQDGFTDQYALACVIYELLSGAPPFAGVFETGDPAIMANAVINHLPEEIEDVLPVINVALLRALSKSPKERFPTCSAFVAALDASGSTNSSSQMSPNVSDFAPSLVVCPICGKNNHLDNTFRCRECGSDYICLSHQDEKTFLCSDCAEKAHLKTIHKEPELSPLEGSTIRQGGETCRFADGWYSEIVDGQTWNFEIKNGMAILGSKGGGRALNTIPEGVLSIPPFLRGCPVIAIGDNAFDCSYVDEENGNEVEDDGSSEDNSDFESRGKWIKDDKGWEVLVSVESENISSVLIPPSVTSIGDSAFCECRCLESLTIPSSVVHIGKSAFCHCNELTTVTIPASVTSIGEHAFYSCGNIKSVSVLSKQLELTSNPFTACTKLERWVLPNGDVSDLLLLQDGKILVSGSAAKEDVSIPPGVTKILDNAFLGNDTLVSISIPPSVTSIGGCAFGDCNNLASVTLPPGLKRIEGSTFSGCCNLVFVEIPTGVTSIGFGAFHDCNNLASLTLPPGLKLIEASTFSGCSNLGFVSIPPGVMSIGSKAFSDCENLRSVTIPSSVTFIGDEAFCRCNNLTSVTLPPGLKSIEASTFSECSNLVSVNIPLGVTSIGDEAFVNCEKLRSVIIPASVTEIGYGAFSGCENLTSVTLQSKMTSIGQDAFSGCRLGVLTKMRLRSISANCIDEAAT